MGDAQVINKYSKKGVFRRIETSIILIIVFTAIATAFTVFTVVNLQNNSKITHSLQSQSQIIARYVIRNIPNEVFGVLNEAADQDTVLFKEAQSVLNDARQIANLKYLYLIKQAKTGEYIYIVDGQDADTKDYCPTGMPVEEGLIEDVGQVLDGKVVFADKVRNTGYGAVYISYWPVFNETNSVIGAVGMEYDASNLNQLDRSSLLIGLSLCVLVVIVLSIVSISVFKSIFTPFYKKLTYLDVFTGFDNRTAFELEIKRLQLNAKSRTNVSIILLKLDKLKDVNDQFGHTRGDEHIRYAAAVINDCFSAYGKCYRISGEEFCVISLSSRQGDLQDLVNRALPAAIEAGVDNLHPAAKAHFSLACGTEHFDGVRHHSLRDVFDEADRSMNHGKKAFF
ncbi:MAG: GGDEF domain-containing protein [Oscillospiraceae bacterium]|nr:GGDEF domain-containing protein [Oscillospiraceae bacterium]